MLVVNFAWGFGPAMIFLKKICRHKQVDVLAPPSGLETTRTTLTFVWNPLKGASDYRLIVVLPAFKWIESYLLDTVVETCRFTLDLPEGEYEWTVRGLNSAYESRDTISFPGYLSGGRRDRAVKNKKFTLFLIGVVLLVWGIVIWRLLLPMRSVPDKRLRSLPAVSMPFNATDSLLVNYPDPFLGKQLLEQKEKPEKLVNPATFFKDPKSSASVEPPPFLFRGRLRQGKKEFVLLEVAGCQNIVAVGSQIEGYRVKKSTDDSVVLWKKQKSYVLYK